MKTSPAALVPPRNLKLQFEMFTGMVVMEEKAGQEPTWGNAKKSLGQGVS